MIRTLTIICLITALSACVGPPKERRPAVKAPPVTAELQQCLSDLNRKSARYSLIEGQSFGGGCSTMSAIKLTGAGVPITNITAIQCPVARALTDWTQNAVQTAARKHFSSKVVRIDTFGAYACRNVIGRASAAGRRSEHATANAIDIGAFMLANGRRITVQAGWNGQDDERDFLRDVRAAACQRFATVLSPDFNAAHHDHLHFDMGRGPFCR